MKLLIVVGARPNFMKVAPILRELAQYPQVDWQLVHTGQHYDDLMSQIFFNDLQLPPPNVYLGIGSGSHAEQTGKMLIQLEQSMQAYQPDLVLVVGDVNSTLAGALAAAKLHIPIAHVEAGLRSFDRTMPEEINRICTDAISELFFTTSQFATSNLQREGIAPHQIYFVGNVMIDSLLACLDRAQQSPILDALNLKEKSYGLLTLHRPANVDDPTIFMQLLEAVTAASLYLPLVFPLHPRTKSRLKSFSLWEQFDRQSQIIITPPLGYLDFLRVLSGARFALIDSSGIQEETTVLGIPCLTMRENTERPETVTEGTNILVGRDPQKILEAVLNVLQGQEKVGQVPELWDGCAAQRIVGAIVQWWEMKNPILNLSVV